MRKLTPDKLPFPHRTERPSESSEDGFYVSLHPDGSVRQVDLRINGFIRADVQVAADGLSATYRDYQRWQKRDQHFRSDLEDLDGSGYPEAEYQNLTPPERERLIAYQHLARWLKGKVFLEMQLERERVAFCAFCQKSARHVKELIAGPTAHICDECVAMCNEIIHTSRST
jgi:hypothetical protein